LDEPTCSQKKSLSPVPGVASENPYASEVGTGTWAAGFFLNSAMYNFARGDSSANAAAPAIVQTIIYTLDYGLDPMQAVRMPRIIPNAAGRLQIEDGFSNEVLAEA
jgi:gamma-glutamyltranspeptidase/glutathione hydrolase